MLTPVKAVVTTKQLIDLRCETERVYVDPSVVQYAVRLTAATREADKFSIPDIAPYVMYGASPRASINLIISARALCQSVQAFTLKGRSLPQ